MKKILCGMLVCLMLTGAALAEERDTSGVTEQNGRLTGIVTGLNERSGQIEPALWVDCAYPDTFSEEQLAVITTEWAELDESKLRQALSESGGSWRESAYERFHAYSAVGGAETLPADAQAEEAKARAIEIAQTFVRDCGLWESRVIKALRPEDEARSRSMNVAPEAREAYIRRELKEWFVPDLRYTWVSLQFRLRGLPAAVEWWASDSLVCSSIANLYIGDAGEVREFALFYAPREADAVPYDGAVKSWREALEEAAAEFSCQFPQTWEDERGRAVPASYLEISSISPGYASQDGKQWYPAWLFAMDRVSDDGLRSPAALEMAIDARK